MMKTIFTLSLGILAAGGLTAQETTGDNSLLAENPPILVRPIPDFESTPDDKTLHFDLHDVFEVPGAPDAQLSYTVEHVSNNDVATVAVNASSLAIDFLAAGQTNVILSAEYEGFSVADTFVIGVIQPPEGNYFRADLEDLKLSVNAYWNGGNLSGGFTTGPVRFHNSYNPEWFSWSGWSYTNMNNDTTPGYENQYSAASGDEKGKNIYATSYASTSSGISFHDSTPRVIKGAAVTNSANAALSMKYGDGFAKKFGGADGTEPDWFKLAINGYLNDVPAGSVDFMLADYTFEDARDDYIITTWQWVELSSLGEVDSLSFSLSSTDNGDYGMNTPAYFCLDNLYMETLASTPQQKKLAVSPFPNPCKGVFMLNMDSRPSVGITIYDISMRQVKKIDQYFPGASIDITDQPGGIYLVRIKSGSELTTVKIINER